MLKNPTIFAKIILPGGYFSNVNENENSLLCKATPKVRLLSTHSFGAKI